LDFRFPLIQTKDGSVRQHREIGVGAGAGVEGLVDRPSLTVVAAEFDAEILALAAAFGEL
jgi:hypothetical protein